MEYLLRGDRFNITTGVGSYNTDEDFVVGPPISRPVGRHFYRAAVSNINVTSGVTWTLGFSYNDFQQQDLHSARFNQKAGVQWAISEDTSLRLAAFRSVKPGLIFNRTIQPTQVAGFNQFFDDANGTEAWSYGIGLDSRVANDVNAGVEFLRRDLQQPIILTSRRKTFVENRNENLITTYMYWVPRPVLALTGEFRFDVYDVLGATSVVRGKWRRLACRCLCAISIHLGFSASLPVRLSIST